jgi:putative transposase
MSKLKRYFSNNCVSFITCNTYYRKHILIENNDIFWKAVDSVQRNTYFAIESWVILPDHFHLILNTGKESPSNILQRIKMSFGANYRKRYGIYKGRVWQNRFWDHIIRSENDLIKHIDYIHYNPVKHGYVIRPVKWKDSSFSEYLQNGYYGADWGVDVPEMDGDFGD